MKKVLTVISLLVVVLQVLGQDAQVEKLKQQIKQHPQQDTFRVNHLNLLAKSTTIAAGQLDTLANEALSISQKINYAVGEGYSLINLATLKVQKGDKPGAFILLQRAQLIAEKEGDGVLQIGVLLGMANAQSQTENQQKLNYYLQAEAIAEKVPDKAILARVQRFVSSFYQNSLSNYPKAMEWVYKSINTAEEAGCQECIAQAWVNVAALYTTMGDHEKGLVYYKKALALNKQLGNQVVQYSLLNNIGERYRLMGNYAEALKSYNAALAGNKAPYFIELNQSNIADVYVRVGNLPLAFKYAFSSLKGAQKLDDFEGEAWIDGILGRAYLKSNKPDSALYYANQGLANANTTGTIEFMRDNSGALANAYALKRDFANAYKYQNMYIGYRDSMVNAQVANQSNVLQYNYDLQKKQAQITELNQQKRLQNLLLIGALVVLGLIAVMAVVLLRNNRQKQKANNLLSKQKKLIEDQRDQTNKALADLQLTQKQLIQSEKMASLGELTAGIAHEIQNPLNFVNNFSEVNMELIAELKDELQKNDKVDQPQEELLTNIEQNLEKIRHHGQRADSIVKGMLQHSRASSTVMEPTNINTLADEYLRLAYHGLRAKDKSFNADLVTHYGENLPVINVVPQDIGRVLLNLYTNAFYAVQQKQKTAAAAYKPTIEVRTWIGNGQVKIAVKDNGIGIPPDIKDKIMQPFFTTKAAGEGTGLGLSLTYDMVVKGHGGTIELNSTEGEGSEFTIALPIG